MWGCQRQTSRAVVAQAAGGRFPHTPSTSLRSNVGHLVFLPEWLCAGAFGSPGSSFPLRQVLLAGHSTHKRSHGLRRASAVLPPEGPRNIIPAGKRQGPTRKRVSPSQAMGPRLDVFFSSGMRASQRRRKNKNCRGPPLHGQGIVEHNVSSSQEKEPWLGRTSQETLVSLSSTEPERKTSEEDRFFFNPREEEGKNHGEDRP